jgi:hypothetical protein
MPMRAGDPGVFICSIDYPPNVKEPTPALHVAPRPGVWLVLALCRFCSVKTGRYCTSHDVRPFRR